MKTRGLLQLLISICLHREQRCLSLGRCGRLLVPGGICQVVSASTLTWFIRYIYYWNLQFLNNIIIKKTKVLLPQAYVTLTDYYLAFQSFYFERTWWRLFQKLVVRTKFDIYVFMIQTYIQRPLTLLVVLILNFFVI